MANALAQQSVRRWLIHRNALLEMVEKLPEHTAHWRPWSDGFTTIQLLHHMAWTVDFFLSALEGRDLEKPSQPETMAEARQLLLSLKEKHTTTISRFTDVALNQNVSISALGVHEPAIDVLHRMIGHEAHHKGQLWLYARLMGIETLPFYVSIDPFVPPDVPASWKGEQVAKRWLMHREAVLVLAEKLPEHTAHWRPWANGWTTLQLLHHLSSATDFFLSVIEGRERHNVEMPSSMQEAVRMIADLKERQASSIAGYTEDILGKVVEITVLGVKEPVVDILHRMIYHEAHHKGQLWVYARMMGIEPPFYVV